MNSPKKGVGIEILNFKRLPEPLKIEIFCPVKSLHRVSFMFHNICDESTENY